MSAHVYFEVVKVSSISSSLWKKQRDRSDGLLMMVAIRGFVEMDMVFEEGGGG